MKGITRYILRQNIIILAAVTVAFTAAVWLIESLRLIDLIVNRGLSAGTFLYLAMLIIPRFINVVLPIAVFIAVVFTYNKLIAESELVVMRASGMSPLDLARPAVIAGVLGSIILLFLSLWLMPAANRAFKDLQFEIRNRFASALLQEGVFNTLSDKLTVYVRSRDQNNELYGLLIQDSHDPAKPTTIMAERGAFVDGPDGPRVLMANGNRQQYDRASGKLSVLSFEKYTLDLANLRDTPTSRSRQPDERYLPELIGPFDEDVERQWGRWLRLELHQRLAMPLSALAFAAIPLACLLPGEFNRRGQTRRVLLAVVLALLLEILQLGARNLAAGNLAAIPLLYVMVILPILATYWLLWRDARRRPARVAEAPAE